MNPEIWIGLAGLVFAVIGGLWAMSARFASKSDVKIVMDNVEKNRAETALQFRDQNAKIDTGFRDVTGTLTQVLGGVNKTNGTVIAHDGRLERVESDLKEALAPAQFKSIRRKSRA